MTPALKKTFTNPPSAYRAKPFWAWNGKLEEGELRRQIRTMHQMGLGGFFMHSRVGLATPYLSREWFDLVGACIDEARKLKMEAWLYDEDRWPSGAAGGLVTKNPQYRMRSLVIQKVPALKAIPKDWRVVAIFAATPGEGAVVRNVQRVDASRSSAPGKGQALYVFHEVLDCSSDWYNGYTYLDTLNPAAVRAFIRTTHEAYRRRFGRHFGRLVSGIFTDEPHYAGNPPDVSFEHSISWTTRLPAVFKQRYGYDLLPHLMELLFDVDGQIVTSARYHYHDCLTHLFVEAFSRQIGEWCARHKLMFTGHVLCEDNLTSQTGHVGDSMRSYEFMQAPGMDLLTEHWRIYDTAKQVSSAARQFGRTWRLTETYGCTGWDFPLEGHKALGDWQMALGINLRCQHLAWYTMAGEAKRDYPASISYQSPWWYVYAKVEDYFARVNVVMTRGTEVRDLLVIHPMESMWLLHRKAWAKDPNVKTLDALMPHVRDMLLQQHLDFDYGSEDIMERHGRITHGVHGPELRIGRAAYRSVLVPPLMTIRRSTLDLLRRFREAGGMIVFAGNPAPYVEARPSGEPADLAGECPRISLAETALARALEPTCRRVSIRASRGKEIPSALYLLREDQTAFFLFICNTSHSAAQFKRDQFKDVMVRDRIQTYPEVQITGFADCAGVPQEWRPEDGRITAARAHRNAAGQWVIKTSLERLASRLFVIPKKSVTGVPPPVPALREQAVRPLKVKAWNIHLSEANGLVLDRPRYRIGNDAWQPETEILRVDRAVRSALGIPLRGGQMVQPWAQKPDRAHKTVPVELVYTIRINTVPTGVIELALEHPERFRVSLNGRPLDPWPISPARNATHSVAGGLAELGQAGRPRQARKWWTDHSMRKLSLDAAQLHPGNNELRFWCDYDANSGLEPCYLCGDFGVKVKGTQAIITPPVTSLKIGDWVKQDLAFYAGHVTYHANVKLPRRKDAHVFLRLPAFRGAGARIFVNDQPAGVLAWPPYEADITAFVKSARTARRAPRAIKLGIEILGHRRNSHGPLHNAQKWPIWTGPAEFITTGDNWREDYQLVPCGLMKPPELVFKTVVS
ncbi:MAG: hypothetical protein KKD33_06985 [Verrucomicrobia bacterium]|nr:hypothetical protein [Verrucomicrobiota bacterium]